MLIIKYQSYQNVSLYYCKSKTNYIAVILNTVFWRDVVKGNYDMMTSYSSIVLAHTYWHEVDILWNILCINIDPLSPGIHCESCKNMKMAYTISCVTHIGLLSLLTYERRFIITRDYRYRSKSFHNIKHWWLDFIWCPSLCDQLFCTSFHSPMKGGYWIVSFIWLNHLSCRATSENINTHLKLRKAWSQGISDHCIDHWVRNKHWSRMFTSSKHGLL